MNSIKKKNTESSLLLLKIKFTLYVNYVLTVSPHLHIFVLEAARLTSFRVQFRVADDNTVDTNINNNNNNNFYKIINF